MSGGTSKADNPTDFNKTAFGNQLGSGLQDVLKGGYSVFDKPLYAGQSDATQGGLASLLGASNNPGFIQGISSTINDYADTAAGNKFGQNAPGYATLRQNVMNDATTAANSPFVSSGTFGSDKHAEALGRGVTGALAGLDYSNYQNDISRQNTAAQMLPQLFQTSTMPGQTQLAAGQTQDAANQAQRIANQDLFRRQQDAPYTNLARILGIGGSGVAPDAPKQAGLTDWLGLGLGAASLFL